MSPNIVILLQVNVNNRTALVKESPWIYVDA